MLSGLRSKLALLRGVILLLLQFCWPVTGQNCEVMSTCDVYALPRHTILALRDSQPTHVLPLTCTGNIIYSQVVGVHWLFTSDLSIPLGLDVHTNPRFRAQGFNLEFRNASRDEEGAYFCQAEYADGTRSRPSGVGCVFVAGLGYYKTCPMTATGEENCQMPTPLQAEVGESVDIDARIEFRRGGSCGSRQRIRLMYLRKIQEDGSAVNVYICSNLGSFGSKPCLNRSRVSVSSQGDSKYDIELRLHNLTAADAGRYFLQVDLDGLEGGRRRSIFKNFTLTIQDKPTTATLPVGTDTPTAPVGISGCSGGSAPLLLLNGEVLSPETGLLFANISEGTESLLCVTNNASCCDGSNNGDPIAQFLAPNKVAVTGIPGSGLFVTKGRQVIRLNRRGPVNEELIGQYCCSIHEQMNCVNISN